jgi:NAD(P)-dependent dehydrogenase (short-subunit alcohol dehydrogenase family)
VTSPDAGNGLQAADKVVLVTGSGRGLGASLARAAASSGARVVVNCRHDQRQAETLGDRIRRDGGTALVHRADVSEFDQARSLVEETVKTFGRVDVLLNTVGGFAWKPVAETEPAEWRGMMASNLDSVYHMCRLVIPHMRRQHWGRIVNIGAVGAERTLGQPKVAAYSAAQAAVIAFSKALALEEARSGITVNVVCPGVLADGGALPEQPGLNLGDRVPVGRPGTPDDVVRAVLFFASPEAGFVTGQVLAVAGGWRL